MREDWVHRLTATKLSPERLAGYRDANADNLIAGRTRDELLGHIAALEAELGEYKRALIYWSLLLLERAEKAEKELAEAKAEIERLNGREGVCKDCGETGFPAKAIGLVHNVGECKGKII
jgi:hypothetical protein